MYLQYNIKSTGCTHMHEKPAYILILLSLKYLMCNFSIHTQAPIYKYRENERHLSRVRGLSFNEVSGWGHLQASAESQQPHPEMTVKLHFKTPPARPADHITRLPICGYPSRTAVCASNSILRGLITNKTQKCVCVCVFGVRGINQCADGWKIRISGGGEDILVDTMGNDKMSERKGNYYQTLQCIC